MSRHVILYRGIEFEVEELKAAEKYFFCTNRRPDIQKGDFVIGRYSMLPFYNEQEKDIKYVGASLINTYNNHLYVSDLQNYVYDLKELTPRTWTKLQDLPENTSFVLKGETNSRKSNWFQDMFAVDKKAAVNVYNRLLDDSLIGYQRIYIREYQPLVKYLDGVNHMPITREFRFFVAYGEIISGGYYWSNYLEDVKNQEISREMVPKSFLEKVIDKIDGQSNFYTIDVGQTQKGEWVVIELNEGQQAGLSCNNPELFYRNLSRVLKEKGK